MKKILAICFAFIINFTMISPVLAEEINIQNTSQTNEQADNQNYTQVGNTFSLGVEDEKIYLVPKTVFKLELESDFDINETKIGDRIDFILNSDVTVSNGMKLPKHTRFSGTFTKVFPSKPMFKRAKAYILVDKIMFPNQTTYTIKMEPKNGRYLKSSQGLNTLRAFPASIGIITFSVISVAVVATECASVVGLIVVPRTCKGFGLLISSLAKGLNYKAKAGDIMEFKLDTPTYVEISDLKY